MGELDRPDTLALLQVVRCGFRPHQIVAAGVETGVPLLQGRRPIQGRATAYVCAQGVCGRPVSDAEALAAALI